MTLSPKEMFLRPAQYMAYIIFMSLCVFSTIDTGLFVYPSLSRSLLMEAGMVLLGCISVLSCIMTGRRVLASGYSFFIVVWIAYILLHAILAHPHELYRTLYLAVTLSFLLSLDATLRTGLLKRRHIEDGLSFIAAIHAVFMMAQKLGMAASANEYFPVTGSNDNPTVTALYLVGVLPILISRARKSGWNWANMMFVFLVIVGILLLRCRTAYIGLCTEAAVYVVMRHTACRGFRLRSAWLWVIGREPVTTKTSKPQAKTFKAVRRPSHRFITIIIMAVVVVGAGVKMYSMKKDSADGRLLIWRLSVEMMADRPSGYGYGLFEKSYNLRQAEYFSQDRFSDAERRTADFVYMPYNDYMEHGVEGGIAGMFFLAAFYLIYVGKAVRERKTMDASILMAFCLMSLTNFVYTSIQPWLLIICCSAFVMAADDAKVHAPQRWACAVNALVMASFLAAAYFVGGITRAQLALGQLDTCMKKADNIPDSQFAAIEGPVATSEAYWRIRAENSMSSHRHDEALAYIRRARQYSSSPVLFGMEAECLRSEGNLEAAMCRMDTLSCMLPHVLRLKLILMRHNASHGKVREALRYAGDIIDTGAKIDTEEARMIIQEAKKYKDIR